MRHVKILGLLAVVAAAFIAFAATASATTLTKEPGVKATALHSSNENGHVKLNNPIANIECSSTVAGTITSQGGVGNPVVGTIETLDFTSCTNSWHVTASKGGTLSLHYKAANEGTLTSSGAEVDTTRLGVTCVYVTAGTTIGTFTGSTPSGKAETTATLDVSASIPLDLEKSSGLCGTANASWSGSYLVTSPDRLHIDEN